MNKMQTRTKPDNKARSNGEGKIIKSFQMVSFPHPEELKKTCIMAYALTEDGGLYEFTGGKWVRLPSIID